MDLPPGAAASSLEDANKPLISMPGEQEGLAEGEDRCGSSDGAWEES